MDCEPGALGMQKCYVNVNTPTGCTTGTPGCTTTRQEVIGDSAQGLVTKAPSNSSWMAWIPNLVSLNNQGQAYQQRTCNPLWSNVFGCREGDEEQADQEIQSSGQTAVTTQKGEIMSSNLTKAGIGVLTLGGLYFGYKKIKG